MRGAWVVAIVLSAVGLGVRAQTPAAAPPATPEQIATAKAEADRLITAAHAEPYFQNITTSASPAVLHRPSGMKCSFPLGDPANAIHIFQSPAAPGDDVSCNMRMNAKSGPGAVTITQYATRPARTPGLDETLAGMVQIIGVRSPDAKAADGVFNGLELNGRDGHSIPHRAARLQVTVNGQPIFTRAAVSIVGAWVITQRLSAPLSDAAVADMGGELMIGLAAIDVKNRPAGETGTDPLLVQDQAADEARRLLKGVPRPADLSDVTANGVTRLKHNASGLVCHFGPDSASNRLIQPAQGLFCASKRDYGVEILELSYKPGATVADARQTIGQFTDKQYPGATPAPEFEAVKEANGAGAPPPEHGVLRYSAMMPNGAKLYVRTAYVIVGDWLLFQRVVGPAATGRVTDVRAQLDLFEEMQQMAARQREDSGVAAVRR
jgi:hypothetical protein